MTTERDQFPEHFTFSQRNGYEDLPEPMKLEQLSPDLRRELCNAVRQCLLNIHKRGYPSCRYAENFIERTLGRFLKVAESQIRKKFDFQESLDYFEKLLMKSNFNRVLDLLEIVFNETEFESVTVEEYEILKRLRSSSASKIQKLFNKHAAPYWLDTSQQPYWFLPRTSEEEGAAARQAMETLRQGGMNGAVTHLRKAARFINTGDHADSIRESIHAVESVARTIDSGSSKTLGPALSSLKNCGLLQHKALEKAFQQLYGYTSDEQGIRHALLDKDAADVGLEDALFMFGACSSFAGYLTQKQRQIQEGGGSRP